ncbi:ribosomal-processing cysteine protease Prp [Bacillus horti]|uniref:Ribosomal processing cysteine protease Prp n=1 Tax=Caldalkalibacillus horti TaxID=77523 RepID=A0ABT9VTI1_9BACI|nr:ribosomal-processing cysteine protease Prp [Bacillus horti]MDQ0164279.1 uncharacterized protein YsxB (DUF464 family) [Bacillus horti]
MIELTIERDTETKQIASFILSGHADYAEAGKDIVCAAVSGISFGTVNAIEHLLNIVLDVEMEEEGGFLHCSVPSDMEDALQEKVQLLLEAMIVSIESIATTEEYKSYIRILKQETDRR